MNPALLVHIGYDTSTGADTTPSNKAGLSKTGVLLILPNLIPDG